MRESLNQASFRGLATADFLSVVAAAGAASVELRPSLAEDSPAAIASLVTSYGLRVEAVNALSDWALPDDPDPISRFDALLNLATATASPLITCVGPLRKVSLPPREVIFGSTAERLQKLVSRAQGTGVRVALELVGRSSTRPDALSGIQSLNDALAIVQAVGEDALLVVDSYNLATAGQEFGKLANVPASRIGIAQLADRDPESGDRALPCRGDLDLVAFVWALYQAGYDGALSLEYFGKSEWADPVSFARSALADLRRLITAARVGRSAAAE